MGRNFTTKALCMASLTTLFASPSFAVQKPHVHDGNPDDRILHMHYVEDEVYHVDLNFRYITMIQFERGETVTAIQIGDSESFQVSRLQKGDVVTVKPLIENARTNMNVITSRNRTYTFFLKAVSFGAPDGQNFRIAFKYKPHPKEKQTFVSQTSGTVATGRPVNVGYQVQGTTDFIPIEVYDDGVNTWLRYSASARRPAVFKTDAKGRESVANFTAHQNHRIQLHGLSKNWTLRIGDEIVCIRKNPTQSRQQVATRAATSQPVSQKPVITVLRQ